MQKAHDEQNIKISCAFLGGHWYQLCLTSIHLFTKTSAEKVRSGLLLPHGCCKVCFLRRCDLPAAGTS